MCARHVVEAVLALPLQQPGEPITMFRTRRNVLRGAAFAIAAMPIALPRLAHAQTLGAALQQQRGSAAPTAAPSDGDVAPFTVNTPEEDLVGLRPRINATR